MRKFVIPTKPYEERLYSRKEVEFAPGLTVLVGCNGSGKSTLMMLIKEQLKKKDDALVLNYDDRFDGGHNLMDKFGFYEDFSHLVQMFTSSEGERIYIGIGQFIVGMQRRIREERPKEIWIFMDAVGSGLSIDGIREIKEFSAIVSEDNPDRDVYFIVSTNEYEFTIGADCLDVTTFKHVTFADYQDYSDYVMKTRKKKDRRNHASET